jgi:SAM-dependent methyltransferase
MLETHASSGRGERSVAGTKLVCPLCRGASHAEYARWSQFAVLACRSCGFRFVDTHAPDYPDEAQFIYDEPLVGPTQSNLPHIRRRVRDILRYAAPPGRALDIGCGRGEVSQLLQRNGFTCTGIDMKAHLIDQLVARHPEVEWRRTTTSALESMSERFDVITMYHVLEHIADPIDALRAVKRLARPGALIVVEVPNAGGLEARLRGRRWHYYKVDHVNYFRAADLDRLAAQSGLRVLGRRGYQHFSYPQDVVWKDAVKGALGYVGFQDVLTVFLAVDAVDVANV